MKEINVMNRNVMCFMGRKMCEERGDSHTLSNVGWCFVAVAIVLGMFALLPNETEEFMRKIFTKLATGLGI